MLEKKNALPGAELHFAIDDRDRFARTRQDHANVRGHVVRAFVIVLVVRVFGNELLKKSLDIASGRRPFDTAETICAGNPASSAIGWCTYHSNGWLQCRAVIRMISSLSWRGSDVRYRM